MFKFFRYTIEYANLQINFFFQSFHFTEPKDEWEKHRTVAATQTVANPFFYIIQPIFVSYTMLMATIKIKIDFSQLPSHTYNPCLVLKYIATLN